MTGAKDRTWADHPERVAWLKALHAEGLSYGEIGRLLGVSVSAVARICDRLRLPPRASPIRRGLSPKPTPARRARRGEATLPPLGSLSR